MKQIQKNKNIKNFKAYLEILEEKAPNYLTIIVLKKQDGEFFLFSRFSELLFY